MNFASTPIATDETGAQTIVSDVFWWTGANSVSYAKAHIVRACNFAMDRVTQLIMKNDRNWEWDDINQDDLPIATTTLVASQRDYGISASHLTIIKVRVKDSGGLYWTLSPIKRRDISDTLDEESDGLPRHYAKLGSSLLLYPKPAAASVTLVKGLEIQFQRPASYFTVDSTTDEPGFATQFHRLIPLYASRDWLLVNGDQSRIARVELEIARLEAELEKFYARRADDGPRGLSMAGISFM